MERNEYCLILLHLEWWQCWCCKVRVARHDIDQRVCLTYKSTHSGLFDEQDTDHSLTEVGFSQEDGSTHLCPIGYLYWGIRGRQSLRAGQKRSQAHSGSPMDNPKQYKCVQVFVFKVE